MLLQRNLCFRCKEQIEAEGYTSTCTMQPPSRLPNDSMGAPLANPVVGKSVDKQRRPSQSGGNMQNTQRSLKQTSILQYFRSSNVHGNLVRRGQQRLPHRVNRSEQDGATSASSSRSPFPPSTVSSRDIVSIPTISPPLIQPPSPQFTASVVSSTSRQHRIQQSPSPLDTAPISPPLTDMGFSISHTESAVQSKETGNTVGEDSVPTTSTEKMKLFFEGFVSSLECEASDQQEAVVGNESTCAGNSEDLAEGGDLIQWLESALKGDKEDSFGEDKQGK